MFCTAADRSQLFPRTPSKCTGSLTRQGRTLCLHARLIEVNGRMTEKIEDLEQTVSGFKSDQYQYAVAMHRPNSIDFSKIEADLTELKTFLYRTQSCTSKTDTREGSLTVKGCNVLCFHKPNNLAYTSEHSLAVVSFATSLFRDRCLD